MWKFTRSSSKEAAKDSPSALSPTATAAPTSFKDGMDFVDKHHTQSTPIGSPRIVFVERGKKGFGFVLRGAKSPHGPSATFYPSEDFPALQYLENVDKGSPADKAGLKKGDFVLEINGEDVTTSPHQYVVSLVKTSPDTIVMKVVTLPEIPPPAPQRATPGSPVVHPQQRQRRRSEADPLPKTPIKDYSSATLPHHVMTRSRSEINPRDLQVARAAALAEANQPKVVASIKKRPSSQKINPDAIKDMYHRQGSGGSRTPGSIPEEGGFLGRPPMPTPPAQYSGSQTIARMSTQKGRDDRMDRHAAMQQMRDVAGIASPPTSRHDIGRRGSFDDDYLAYSKDRTVSDPGDMGLPPPPSFAPTPPPAPSSLYASVGDFPPSDPPPPPPPGPPPGGPPTPDMPPPPPPLEEFPMYADVNKQKSPVAAAPPPPPPPPPPDSLPSGGGGSFANSIAAAAALRERRKSTKGASAMSPSGGVPPPPPPGGMTPAFEIAMAAKDSSLRQAGGPINRNQNADTQHSALEAAVARRKSQLESGRSDSIEEKIQKSKEAKASKGMNPNEDLMAAIAKRRTVVEKQQAEAVSSTPFSNQIASAAGQMQNKLAVKPKPVRNVPAVSPTDPSDGGGVLLIPPSVTNIKQTFEKSKKPPVGLPPVVEGNVPFPPAPDYPMNQNEDNQNFGAILTRFNSQQNRTRMPPGRSAVVEVVSPAHGQHMGARREGSSDTSSVVSSGSSASTLSTMSMSTEPSSDMFDGGDDDFPKKNNTVKSNSSSASSSTVTSNSSWTRRESLDDNRGSFQNKTITIWNPIEVGDWLSSLNLNEYRDTFINNDITGELLLEMTKDDLTELGVSSLGHKMSILKAVKKLTGN